MRIDTLVEDPINKLSNLGSRLEKKLEIACIILKVALTSRPDFW